MNKLLADVIEVHGGLDRWSSVSLGEATIITGGSLWGEVANGHDFTHLCLRSR